ncbi:TPA: hypothetical protein ACIPUI_000913 [Citrobacter freundii]
MELQNNQAGVPETTLTAELGVLPDFTGRVLLYIENGKVMADYRLLDKEIIASEETLTAIFEKAICRAMEVMA